MKLNEIFLNEFKDEMAVTIKFLEATSEDLFEFQPHEKAKKLNDLLNHMLPIPSWIAAIAPNSELDWSKATPPEVLNTKEGIIKQFKANVAIGEKALKVTNNEQLLENWTMRNGDTVLFTGKKETAIRRYVLNHIIHHRAQLGMYIRLNNDKVPASYIRSADEMLF